MRKFTALILVAAVILTARSRNSSEQLKESTEVITETAAVIERSDISAQIITADDTQTDMVRSNFVGKKFFEYKINDNYYLSAAYPVLQGLGTESRTAEINSQFADFTNEIDYIDSCYKEGSPERSPGCEYEIGFSIVQDTSEDFILRINYIYFDAGPYPKYGSRYYTFDVETGKQKELEDYFVGVEGYRERILKYLKEMIDKEFNGSAMAGNINIDAVDFAVYNDILHISFDRGDLTISGAPQYEIPMTWIINGRNW